jgi:hypothetical protein
MATDKTDLPGASVTVNIAGGSDAPFVYSAMPAPITLETGSGNDFRIRFAGG